MFASHIFRTVGRTEGPRSPNTSKSFGEAWCKGWGQTIVWRAYYDSCMGQHVSELSMLLVPIVLGMTLIRPQTVPTLQRQFFKKSKPAFLSLDLFKQKSWLKFNTPITYTISRSRRPGVRAFHHLHTWPCSRQCVRTRFKTLATFPYTDGYIRWKQRFYLETLGTSWGARGLTKSQTSAERLFDVAQLLCIRFDAQCCRTGPWWECSGAVSTASSATEAKWYYDLTMFFNSCSGGFVETSKQWTTNRYKYGIARNIASLDVNRQLILQQVLVVDSN